MSPLTEALAEVASALAKAGIPYAIIGGVASGLWGEPRFTSDVDFVIGIESRSPKDILERLGQDLRIVTPGALERIQSGTHIQVATSNGITADLLPAALPLYQSLLARATIEAMDGQRLRVCTPEDLILLKIISDRGKDREDVQNTLNRRHGSLDFGYIEGWLKSLAETFGEDGPLRDWLAMKKETLEFFGGKSSD